MKLNRIQRIILKDLYKSAGKLDSYTFYCRYYITPILLAASMQKLLKKELITEAEGVFRITKAGKDFVIKGGLYLEDNEEKPWKVLPNEFVDLQIPPWFPYVPEIDLLDKKHFKLK